MLVREIKGLFFDATNAKVVMGGNLKHSERLLRKALKLSKQAEGSIWPKVSAYRLAHLLFRNAKNTGDLTEILELVKYSENSESEYIKFHSKLIKFAAIDRLRRLGLDGFDKKLIQTQQEILETISALQQVLGGSKKLEGGEQSIQGSHFNLVEYMTYMAGIDYLPLLGVGYSEQNKLLIDGTHDLWRIIGQDGPIDEFSYNHEIGLIELNRIVRQEKVDGWYILGATGIGNELHNGCSDKPDKNTQRITILNEIIKSGSAGAKAAELASLISPQNYETEFDGGSREKPGASAVKKHRARIKDFFGKDLFVKTSEGRARTNWALSSDVKIYGLVNQKHLR
jgi:hypothetical protein